MDQPNDVFSNPNGQTEDILGFSEPVHAQNAVDPVIGEEGADDA